MDNKVAQATWNACLREIEKNVSAADFNQWFVPLKAVDLEGSVLTLNAPTPYFVETVEKSFLTQLTMALRKVIGSDVRLRYSVSVVDDTKMNVDVPISNETNMGGGYSSATLMSDPFKGVALRGRIADPQLNKAYTFENYIIGAGNKMAASVGEAVASSPGKTAFNPLFVYGGPGVGKTHLIQAVGARAKAANANITVAYLSADRFMRQYMDARGANEINGFIHFYQRVELLILDDIQELGGRAGTADAFFQIFNHLLQNGRQVVLASDKRPAELVGLQERLLSRFKSGMVVEICPPDRETRLGIVRAKAGAEGLSLPEDVAQYVASNVSGNARELQGALVSLLAYATVTNTDVDLQLTKHVIDTLVSKPKTEMITKDSIINAVCNFYNIEPDAILQNTRKRETVIARQIAMYLCKKYTNDSLATIGMYLGNKQHTTVVYACRTIEGLIETDPKIAEIVKSIVDGIR